MSEGELEVLKQSLGELISFNSFLSTIVNRNFALFLFTNETSSDELERVLLEIDANSRLSGTKSFADVTILSYFPQEPETLFMLGSIFRVRSIDLNEAGVSILRLTLCSELDHDLRSINDYLKSRYINNETDLLSLGNLLLDMGRYGEGEKHFRRYLNATSTEDPNGYSLCLHFFAMVAMKRGDYERSLLWFNRSSDMKMVNRIRDDNVGYTLNAMVTIYAKSGDHARALRAFQDALCIFQEQVAEDDFTVAMCLRNIGSQMNRSFQKH